MSRAEAIAVHHAGKRYDGAAGTVVALDGVSLSVGRGDFVTLIGRSGCGKSTLLRLVAGLLQPSTGSIAVDGEPVAGPPPAARYVFQDYGESLFPWKTVTKNVEFGIRHAGRTATQAPARQFLDLVGLGHVGDRYPWELSGGMQQRVAIARALASAPQLLLMDEPFGAVDALSRAGLQDMILRVWAELGLTVVLVTHDIDEAIYLADRVVVLEPGGQGILADVAVDLPRPRTQIGTRDDTRFGALRRHLAELVLSERE